MTKFGERLLQAASHIGVGKTQSEIADSLGLSKQTVHHWFTKGVPNLENAALVERKWGISAEWLRSGEGEMLPPPKDLPSDELELLRNYRRASPQTRDHIRTMARALRKSVVTIAVVLPGFMAPNDSQAGGFNINKVGTAIIRNTHWMLSLLSAFRKLRARFSQERERLDNGTTFAHA